MMRLLQWVAATSALVAAVQGQSDVPATAYLDCECGMVGENCDQVGYYYKGVMYKVDEPVVLPNVTCAPEGSWGCTIKNNSASCLCYIGYEGADCAQVKDILEYSLIIGGFVLPILILILATAFLYRHDKNTDGAAWKFPPSATTQGFASKYVLLVYRVAVLAFAVYVIYNLFPPGSAYKLYYFTIWNYFLFTSIFLIGTTLSSLACFSDYHKDRKDPNFIEKALYVMIEVELPMTILVAAVYWTLLSDGSNSLVNTAIHGANVPMLLAEFMMNGLRFNKYHMLFGAMWGALYLLVTFINTAIRNSNDQGDAPPYAFLTSTTPFLVAWVVGLLIVMSGFFALTYQCNRWKKEHESDLEEDGRLSVKKEDIFPDVA